MARDEVSGAEPDEEKAEPLTLAEAFRAAFAARCGTPPDDPSIARYVELSVELVETLACEDEYLEADTTWFAEIFADASNRLAAGRPEERARKTR